MFNQYVEHGWKICRIPEGTKGPRDSGWNDPKRMHHFTPAEAAELKGAGLCHSLSGTCALDIDNLDETTKFLQEHGIDLSVLLIAPDAVRITSGRVNRAKLLYRLPEPMLTIKPANGAFELRSQSKKGTTVQDVLPPTIHPDTHKPYAWIGDWRNLPMIPAELLALWKSLVSTQTTVERTTATGRLSVLADLLERQSPDCGYETWIRIGMACHHESEGSDAGFALWDEWSAPSDKYPGLETLRSHWVSFGKSDTPITVDSIRKTDVATVTEFEDLALLGGDWFDQATKPSQDTSLQFNFLSLNELFERPEPEWIIPGVLPEVGLGSFWGQPSGGKTFLAVDMAISVALGTTWRGLPVKQGSVLYIAAEDDSGVQVRFKSALMAKGVVDAPVRVLPAAPVFTSKPQTDALLQAIGALGKQRLVVVDTLAAVTPGSDENAAKDMSQVIHFCQRIHKTTGGLVLLIHHEGKTSGRGPRGWSGLHGAFDVEWEVTDQEDHREMRISKMKNAPIGNVYPFVLLPIGDSCIVEWLTA